jgi:signal transduction histidine kinase
MESFTVARRKLQKLQRILLGAAVAATFFGELVYVLVQRISVFNAALDGLVTMAIVTALVQFSFHIIYRQQSTEQRPLQESLILLDIATAVSSTPDVMQALKLMAGRTARACQVHRCSVFLWDEGRQGILPLMSQYASGSTDMQLWERFRSATYTQRADEVPVLKQVIEGRQPVVLDGATLSALPEAWTKPFGVIALLLVPLVSRDRVIGLMALDQVEPGRFRQEQVNLAMTIGSQVAAAVENARLIQQLSEKARRLTLLAEISMAVTSTLEPDSILNTAAAGLCRLFAVDQCGMVICDWEHAVGRLAAEYPPREPAAQVTIPLPDDPVFQRILAMRQPVVVEDAQHDPLLLGVRQGMQQRDIQSALIVPLLVKGEAIGAFGLGSTQGKRAFTAEEIELAQTIANQISVAMDNARLYQQRMNDISTLKEVDQFKSNLVSNVSHELRAPLTSIKAYTELLLAEAERAKNDTSRDWLTVIDRETDRLTGLITDYLSLSRLESGHFELTAGPLRLADVIAEVVAVLDVQAKLRHITVQVEAQPALPELWADGELIRVVVRNLVSNAIKFSHDGGHIHITIWHDDGTLKFSVQDEGPGIPAEALPHLFDKFFRVPTTSEVPGTGLGLALAKEAVMAHGGRIEANSTAGKGSRFTVSIPARGRAKPRQDQQAGT